MVNTHALQVPETYRPLTVSSGVRTSALKFPDRVALRHGHVERTFCDLIKRIDALAIAAGTSLGLEPGQHVGILAPNCIAYIETVLALSDAGMPAVTLSARLNRVELTEICNDACIRVLFVHPDCLDIARSATFKTVKHLVVFGPEYESLLQSGVGAGFRPIAGEWDIFSIPFTSGTTGRPKGVMLPHRAPGHCCSTQWRSSTVASVPRTPFWRSRRSRMAPGLAFAIAPIFFGGTCELVTTFEAAGVIGRLRDGRFTGVFMVPTHLHAILSLSDDVLAAHRDVALKSLISNAAPLSQRVKEQVVALWGDHLLHETYGSTEVGIACNIRPADQLRKQGSVGLAFPNCAIEVRDPDGREVPANEIGELYTNSPFMFSGYWQQGGVTPPPLQGGWFSAGDMASRMTKDSFISSIGRTTW